MKPAIIILSALIIFAALDARIEKMRAVELFGEGTAVTFSTARTEAGIISSTWPDGEHFIFAFAGLDGRGYIVQLWGERVNQYGPYVHSNSFAFYYERQTQTVWSGRIEFRGHDRPFCGGERIPSVCLWK